MDDLTFPPVATLIPHAGQYILLDALVACAEAGGDATATIPADSFLLEDGHASPIYGIELIAQTVAAVVGCQRRARGEEPRIGLLISIRLSRFYVAELPIGIPLRVRVANRWGSADLGQFSGDVLLGETVLVHAELGVYAGDLP